MKKLSLTNFVFIFIIIAVSIINGMAQGGPPPGNQFGESQNRPVGLLEALGLSKDQVQQIRQLNKSLQPMRQEAQRRFAQANKALDDAIYADEPNDVLINERMKEVQNAQAELIRTRTLMETSVRKILTKDQLIRFRELRERQMKNQRNPEGPPPQNRQNQRPLLRKGQRPPI